MPARTTTLPKFARLLGQPVTTVRRLFNLGILPETLVAKSAGKHWRLSFSDEQLQHCKASLVLWSLWRRKRRASRTYARRDELSSTAIKLILAEVRSPDARNLKSPEAKIDAFSRALSILNSKEKDTEGVWWNQKILANPMNLEAIAAFILRTAVVEFRKQEGRDPTRKELAEALGISERSVYRFDKNALNLAYLDRQLTGSRDEEKAEQTADPQQEEYDRIARNHYATLHQPHGSQEKRRKRRRQKAHWFELVWEKDPTGPGEMLVAYPMSNLKAKRRLELTEAAASGGDYDLRRVVKQSSRQVRRAKDLEKCDPTFGAWTAAAYIIEPDGKYRWWTNFDASEGRAPSAADARCEILALVGRSKPRFPIVNLREMLAG